MQISVTDIVSMVQASTDNLFQSGVIYVTPDWNVLIITEYGFVAYEDVPFRFY